MTGCGRLPAPRKRRAQGPANALTTTFQNEPEKTIQNDIVKIVK
jgi:hypothetical protein